METQTSSESEQQTLEHFAIALPKVDQLAEYCPQYHRAMGIIGKKWTGSILRVLIHRAHHYNEILLAIPGISDRLLTERLRDLETEGLVVRRIASTSPVRVEYELTAAGQELDLAIRAISVWAVKWLLTGLSVFS